MTFSPNDIPLSPTGSQNPILHSAIPTDLSDFAAPTLTDPKISAKFIFENILLTNKGEMLSDPNFGVGLRSYLFQPENSFYDLESEISSQLSQYAEGIQILGVSTNLEGIDQNSISVSITYLNPDKTIEQYLLNTDLSSQRTSVYV